MTHALAAPEWDISEWLNTDQPLQLSGLRGRVVVIHAFQMLCPGCVSHGIPQATEIHNTFASDDLVVVGLHTVFEHLLAKKIIRLIKDSKLKVQASIQGEAVRISGAKRDTLQEAIQLVKKSITEFPLQFQNFRE